jgi:broad specificity phosphatase PhoE
MRLVLVRHAMVETDPEVHPALWQLSDEGRAGARALAREPLWLDIERIYCSPELKAHETAQIIAGPNGISVILLEDLREVERPSRQWFGDDYPGGYAGAVAEYMRAPDAATHGWEPPAKARERMRACIEAAISWNDEPCAIAGHGMTLSLYVSAVTGEDVMSIWPSIGLPDYAVLDLRHRTLVEPFGRWQARPAR